MYECFWIEDVGLFVYIESYVYVCNITRIRLNAAPTNMNDNVWSNQSVCLFTE